MPKVPRIISSKKLQALYDKGLNSRQIADKLGISNIWARKLKGKLKSGEQW